jgi:hypothetical protein
MIPKAYLDLLIKTSVETKYKISQIARQVESMIQC